MSEWLINREAVEERFGQPLTEEEWRAVTEEVAGRVENFIEEILDGVLEMKVWAEHKAKESK
jgi:hypothetical protein